MRNTDPDMWDLSDRHVYVTNDGPAGIQVRPEKPLHVHRAQGAGVGTMHMAEVP